MYIYTCKCILVPLLSNQDRKYKTPAIVTTETPIKAAHCFKLKVGTYVKPDL